MNRRRAAPSLLDSGWSHLASGRWESAREAFRAALERGESPEALEGLSWAAWWLDDADTVFEARRRAYRLYLDRGERGSAARMATWLAADQLDFHGASSVASGWVRRARRLLDDLDTGPDHGWLAFHEGYIAAGGADPDRALALAREAAEIGHRFDVPDLQMLGLALEGAVLVGAAEVEPGMACLDEAAATALATEATIPISSAWVCCFLVTACESVRDWSRAFEWCDRIAAFAERYGSRYMLAFCRAHYGAVHMWRGRWAEAESQLQGAIEDYRASRPAFVGGAKIGLAELRRRQGRWDDVESLLEGMTGSSALLCQASMSVDRGDFHRATELADRALRQLPEHGRMDRIRALEVVVRARVARGDQVGAGEALVGLRAVVEKVGTAALEGAVRLAEGIVARERDHGDEARRLLEDSVDLFEGCGAPFEAAVARVELAICLEGLGRRDAARREAGAALEVLAGLGAEAEARRARSILEDRPEGTDPARPRLSRREGQVLGLVAEGFTNRQIAARLVLSEHTIHRHVANILRKLGVSSRTAAVSIAARSGLLDAAPE